jgi:hypothetical protein
LDFSYECSICVNKFSIYKIDESTRDFYKAVPLQVLCDKCNKENKNCKPQEIRILKQLRWEWIGNCNHCSKAIVLYKENMTKPTITECNKCGSSKCFLKTIKPVKTDLTKPHLKDMCEKCKKEGKYCGG